MATGVVERWSYPDDGYGDCLRAAQAARTRISGWYLVLLTQLREGQEATVLQLPTQPKTSAEEAAQKRVAYVG